MRELAIAMLSDSHGIDKKVWRMLSSVLEEEEHYDILKAVTVDDGRFYLPETWL